MEKLLSILRLRRKPKESKKLKRGGGGGGSGMSKSNGYERTPLGDSVDKASMRLLKECFESASDKNVIASPLGVLSLLAMVSAGSEGETRDEIMQLLNCTNYVKLEKSYGSLTEKLSSMDSDFLVLANRVYVSKEFTLCEKFSNVVKKTYKSKVEQLDFIEDRKTAVKEINQWACEKTQGHITSPVDENMFNAETVAALFNVIFFKGQWNVPFKAKDTREEDFYVTPSKTVKKPMMKLYQSLFYHKDAELGASMVELPYKEQGFRMVVVLPDEKDGLQKVVEKLAQRGLLEHVFELRPAGRHVVLDMPKFEIESKLDLNSILPTVGVSRIFTEGAHSVVRERAVKVSKVFQQAFVKVDEEGATAGAFTGAIYVLRRANARPPPPIYFKVDHPFLFAILHEDIVLFTGTYTH